MNHTLLITYHRSQKSRLYERIGLVALAFAAVLLVACPMPEPLAAPSPEPTAPAALGNLTVVAGDTEVVLSWEAVTGAESYRVYRDGSETPLETTNPITAPTYTDTSLNNSTEYTYTVRAVGSNGLVSGDSDVVTVTPTALLAPPRNLIVTFGSEGVRLTWVLVDDAISYNIYRDGELVPTDSPITVSPYIDTDRTAGATYTYRVRTVDGFGRESERSTPVPITLPPLLGSPNLIATFGSEGVRLTWAPVDDAISYNIYRDDELVPTDSPITASPYIDTDRTAGATYTYRVQTVDGFGRESERSTPVPITLPPLLAPPGNVRGVRETRFFRINWDAVTDAVNYKLYRNGELFLSPTTATVARFEYVGAGGVPQIFTVRAVDGFGRESEVSVPVSLAPPVVNDFTNLNTAGNVDAYGIWSDGETMWVADDGDNKLYAYSLVTKAYTPDRDIALAGTNTSPRDLWSDGETMWVVNNIAPNAIFAYNLTTGNRDTAREFTSTDLGTDNFSPVGIWSDKTSGNTFAEATMWVVSEGGIGANNIFAYNMESKARVTDKEFVLNDGSNANYRALWSNGETIWLLDGTEILAYTLAGGARNASLDFSSTAPVSAPRGIWAKRGSTIPFGNAIMWIAENDALRAFGLSSRMPMPTP